MSCTLRCRFRREAGERYRCTSHPANAPHQCSSSRACSSARPSSFDGALACPISGRVFRHAVDSGAGEEEEGEEAAEDRTFRRRDARAAREEIEETLRELFAVGAWGADGDAHAEAYAWEVARLWPAYQRWASAPVTPRAFTLGVLARMARGLSVDGVVVLPADAFAERLLPNAAQLESLTRGTLTRKQCTAGTVSYTHLTLPTIA